MNRGLDMEKKIREIIENENLYNPYKDDQIADMINTTRSNIVRIRKSLNIESYNTRRMPVLLEKIKEIAAENRGISTVDITKKLNEMGFDVSRFLVAKLKDGIFDEIQEVDSDENSNKKTQGDSSIHEIKDDKYHSNELLRSKFSSFELIGEDGSIKNSQQLMRAAMVYPSKGLHTIIIGETGTGKSELVDTIYKKLISNGELSPSKKLIKYNCANYANNPELLMSQLFGHVKGSFTGADSDRDGIIKEANGGILFLDEIHRLSKVGQEMLFTVIDDGKYRKLGQNSSSEDIEVMIIGATTEDVNSNILSTFRRRIPMIIELPSLENRSVNERFQLIVMILQAEANNLGKRILINSLCLINLLTYRCLGNIGQLSSDIKVAIANAYLKFIDAHSEFLELKMSDFPRVVHESLTKHLISTELDLFRDHGLLIKPNGNKVTLVDERNTEVKPEEICDLMKLLYQSFQKQKLPKSLMSNLLSREIKYRVTQIIKTDSFELKEGYLLKDTGYNIDIEDIVRNIEEELGELKSEIKVYLKITMEDIFKKIDSGWEFPDVSLSRAEKDFLMEYRVAWEALNKVFEFRNDDLPRMIIGIVATYIHFGYIDDEKNDDVRVVIITHGKAASAIADVCNYYVHEKILSAIDIPLDFDKEEYINYVINIISEYEEKSLLLLVDLGTPLLLGEIISKKTNKLTKTVGRVDLALALEAAIKAKKKGITLTEIYVYLKNKAITKTKETIGKTQMSDNIIIVSCITGQGAANNIKTFIKENFNGYLSNVDILSFGVITPEILEYIKRLMDTHNIVSCIGTYVIDLPEVTFIEMSELVQDKGRERLIKLLEKTDVKAITCPSLSNYIHDDAIFFDKIYLNKAEAIGDIATKLFQLGYVTEEFKYDALKREAFISTDYKYGVSLPHTGVDHVIKTVISITRFTKPIVWNNEYKCNIMIMLALKKEDVRAIRALRKIIESEEFRGYIIKQDKKGMFETIAKCESESKKNKT
jgi:transcriptional regulator with AAA-type ATPase domain/transcriptional regulatory protein LevR/mannitol/fructose-specific phosphotransferase system IIA component